ncbi:hypothetical protein SAMN05216276_11142 [Streptosporangium subroseum]|uniref:Uncharacterized protein n=1 Tax=Streptosporangium subroseum TaxID=106412 RepID=A0A239PCA1_9ACTN|nr:hypothetical protein SAMN05216276_11142 [Streptosporangium subroseum]
MGPPSTQIDGGPFAYRADRRVYAQCAEGRQARANGKIVEALDG